MLTRKWLSGRASPCQGEGRGFESRLPLQRTGRAHARPVCSSGVAPCGVNFDGARTVLLAICGRGGMADAADLNSVGETRAGSTPAARTSTRLSEILPAMTDRCVS